MVKKIIQVAMFSCIIILLAAAGLHAQEKIKDNRELIANNFQATAYIHYDAGINLLSEKYCTASTVETKNQTKKTVIPARITPNSSSLFNSLFSYGTYFKFPVVLKVEKGHNSYKNTTSKIQDKDIAFQIKDVSQINDEILLAFFGEDDQ